MSNVTVTIPKEEYEEILKAAIFLECLQSAGVDNWSGYSYACELYNEGINNDEETP